VFANLRNFGGDTLDDDDPSSDWQTTNFQCEFASLFCCSLGEKAGSAARERKRAAYIHTYMWEI
jgi:hypothetical protein